VRSSIRLGDPEMNMATFVGFVLLFALSIWGRRLREKAFRELSIEQKIQVTDKIPNYTSTEMIPFAGLLLGLVGILLFRLAWLSVAFAIFLPLIVFLVSVLHLRTRHRFRKLGFPAAFLSQYEHSRIISYSALGVPLAIFAWVIYR
jgi:sterol desaturase/sphingolipid hydroxylase (fatty acid hydroxylase superfamily)